MEDRFAQAVNHFNTEDYFEAHEVWEDLWNEASGPRHAFLQCLIQVAVALHHGRNGNFNGARKLSASALGYLEKGRSDSDPVNLDELKDRVLDFVLAIETAAKGEKVELPLFKLPMK